MIQRLVGFCLIAGLSFAGPLSRKGAFAPAPPGGRPSCATKGMTFCEEVDKYPAKLIQKLLQTKSMEAHVFFVDESEGLDEPPDYVLHEEMAPTPVAEGKSRKVRSLGDNSNKGVLSKMCSVPSRTPEIASNSKGEWRSITHEETAEFQHKFRGQMCDEKEECKKSCRQFFAPISVTFNDHSGKVMDDIFWMPSSCLCFDESDNVI